MLLHKFLSLCKNSFKEKSVMGSKSKKKVEVALQESLNSDDEWNEFMMKEVKQSNFVVNVLLPCFYLLVKSCLSH